MNLSPTLPAATAPVRPVRATGAGRPRKNEGAPETATAILDCAEELFALHGFHGVTLRVVAERAEVNSAMVHYYFQTKQGLFDAVFMRRADIVNGERLDMMADYEREHGQNMTVEGVVTAFLTPLLDRERHADRGWKNYFAIAAQVNNSAVAWGANTMGRTFDQVVQRLIAMLARALPTARKEDLFWSYHMLTGSLTLTLSDTGRLDRLSNGLCSSSDIDAIAPRMVQYCAAGFRAVCTPAHPGLDSDT